MFGVLMGADLETQRLKDLSKEPENQRSIEGQ